MFRLCHCLSTSGPDQSLTWYPIRVVLLAMCAVKPLFITSFVTQCVRLFSPCGFRHNSVYVSVQWHGLKKKKNKTIYYFTHHVSFACCFLLLAFGEASLFLFDLKNPHRRFTYYTRHAQNMSRLFILKGLLNM